MTNFVIYGTIIYSIMIDELSLKNFKIDEEKIKSLGFIKQGDYFIYSKKILNDEFLLNIEIHNTFIKSSVVEIETNEKYVLYDIADQSGTFVGKMRAEYDSIINTVKESCCSKFVFHSKCANDVINYVEKKYGDKLEFLWDKFTEDAIIRNKINDKWYLLFMIVDKKKLGLNEQGKAEILDIRLETDEIPYLIDNKRFFPAYHMNKKHWISINLDECSADKEIYKLINNSYNLSIKRK